MKPAQVIETEETSSTSQCKVASRTISKLTLRLAEMCLRSERQKYFSHRFAAEAARGVGFAIGANVLCCFMVCCCERRLVTHQNS